jgi:hypothetical protein
MDVDTVGQVDTRTMLATAALRRAAAAARVVVAEVARAARIAAEPGPQGAEPLPLAELVDQAATGAERAVLLYAANLPPLHG